jgi:uncharacterized protein
MIQEIIVTTTNEDGSTHIAPMGVHEEEGQIVIAPFKPSATLDNVLRNNTAVINRIDDVRIFAGCLTGRKDWPLSPTEKIKGYRLQAALSHVELELNLFEDDEIRPHFYCKPVYEAIHKPFQGFNRAQSAVLEAAILVSRLHMLTKEKIDQELEYLTIAIDKTAGEKEKIAWQWLMEKVESFRQESLKDKSA